MNFSYILYELKKFMVKLNGNNPKLREAKEKIVWNE